MSTDLQPVLIVAASQVHGTQAPTAVAVQSGGKFLPHGGNAAAVTSAVKPAVHESTPQVQVSLINKFLNDSGKPDQFRVDPTSNNERIQEINPASGEVIAVYSSTEFVALARSLGITGVLVDSLA